MYTSSIIIRENLIFYRVVLEAVPLHLYKEAGSGSHDFPRSWMLPVMKEHIERTELAYFTQAMLPLAAQLRTKGEYTGTRLSLLISMFPLKDLDFSLL